MTRVLVAGCAGRMGSEVCRLIAEQPDMELVGGIEAKGHQAVGTKLGTGTVGTDLSAVIAKADVVADFSSAEATVANCWLAVMAQSVVHVTDSTMNIVPLAGEDPLPPYVRMCPGL